MVEFGDSRFPRSGKIAEHSCPADTMNSPEDVVAAAFAAINTEDWHGLTALCDPLSLAVFKKQTIDSLIDLAECYDVAEGDPEFDAMERIRYEADPTWFLRYEVAGISSIDEVKEMDPGRVFVRWLQAKSPAQWPDDPLENAPYERDRVAPNPGERKVRSYRYKILGSVPDGSDIAYVLFRPSEPFCDVYPEAYQECLKRWSDDERRFMAIVHNRGDPSVVICRNSGESWQIIAKRNFFLFDSLDVVEVNPGG